PASAHYNQVNLGADYALSKRTDLYALFGYQKASGNTLDASGATVKAAASVGAYGVNSGTDTQELAIVVRRDDQNLWRMPTIAAGAHHDARLLRLHCPSSRSSRHREPAILTVCGRRNAVNVQKVMWLVDELALPHRHVPAGGGFGV
ncbi:hypothetical protein QM334_37615, partial [Burkholderia cenocepacia]|nr:hypothetical protein [Burkholderia cenocepacia]